jgi:hypothetical protein
MQHAVKKYGAAVQTLFSHQGHATHRDVFRKRVATDSLSAPGQLVVVLRRLVECRLSDADEERLSVEAFPPFVFRRSIPCTTTRDSRRLKGDLKTYAETIRASQIEGHDAHGESLFDESRTPTRHQDDWKTPERSRRLPARPRWSDPEQAIDDTIAPVIISRVTIP